MPRWLAVALCFLALPAWAQEAELGMVTGDKTGTYYAFGQDLAAQLKPEGITLDVKTSSGSIDNLQRIANSKENAALGVVQSDVIAFLLQSKKPESREIAKSLRMVMPLYPEEIHVLARTNINSLADLTGKRVVVGPAGSGSMMTSVNLFSLLDIKPANMFQVDAPEGVVAVMANRADAMIFVGGTPVPMFKNLESLASAKNGELGSLLQDVHFVPLTEEKLKEQYEPAEITSADYSFVTTPRAHHGGALGVGDLRFQPQEHLLLQGTLQTAGAIGHRAARKTAAAAATGPPCQMAAGETGCRARHVAA